MSRVLPRFVYGSKLIKRQHISNVERNKIAFKQKWTCAMCRQLLPPTFEIDHIVALCNGGVDQTGNMQALCNNCHAAKTSTDREQRFKRLRQEQKEKEQTKQKTIPVIRVSRWFSETTTTTKRKRECHEDDVDIQIIDSPVAKRHRATKQPSVTIMIGQ